MSLTEVSSEQSLPPGFYLRNPFVKREQGWYPTEHCDAHEKDDQPPRGDTQRRAIESLEVQPCADVDETGTVKHEIDHGSERFCFGLLIEPPVPGHRRACEILWGQYNFLEGILNVPAANAASRSSIPRELATPMVNTARARY